MKVARALILLVLASCGAPATVGEDTPLVEVASAPSAEALPPTPPEPGRCFIGVLRMNTPGANGDTQDYCVGGVHYLGTEYRLGRLPLFGKVSATAERYVLLRGTQHNNLLGVLRAGGECPTDDGHAQARADWNHEDGGYHTTEERLAAALYLRALSLTPISIATIHEPDLPRQRTLRHHPEVAVTLHVTNPLPQPLSGLEVVVHYEGGRGKPMPRYQTHPLPTVNPGGKADHRYPITIESNGTVFRYASLSIEGQTNDCTFVPSTFRR